MKNILCLIFLCTCLTSCWRLGMLPPRSYTPCIYYKNATGEDLLDVNTHMHYNVDSIYVLFYINGTSHLEKGNIVNITPVYSMPVGHALSIVSHGQGEMWIIQLSKSDSDTLRFEYSKSGLDKMYYNTTVITPAQGTTFPVRTYFPVTITKSP